jgi:hypothetical protein
MEEDLFRAFGPYAPFPHISPGISTGSETSAFHVELTRRVAVGLISVSATFRMGMNGEGR